MNILVLHAQALHLGFLGCYGNEWVATPNLDRLAAEGIVFDQHYVDSPHYSDKRPRSILTGEFAWSPRTVGTDVPACSPNVHWIDTPSLNPPWNLSDDMLRVYGEDEDEPLEPWPDPPIGFLPTSAFTDLERLQNTYAAAVTHWDARLGDILEPLRASGQLDDLLLCVTASSGLPLGEHGVVGPHRPWLYEEAVHVPLILRLPKARETGLRIAALTQPVDLLPTFLEYLNESAPPSQGLSLWPLIAGDVAKVWPFACSAWEMGPARELALRTAEWAFILPESSFPEDLMRAAQLYRKPDDRWEVNDVRQQHLELAEGLERALLAFMATARSRPGPVSFPPLPSRDDESVL